MSNHTNPLLVVCGPTASGKSALALFLALRYGGEIVNCDSLQIYRGMNVGTAKPSAVERTAVRHHLFDLLEPSQVFNAGQYAAEARRVIAEITARKGLPVVVGGTGFYLRALLDGLAEGPTRDDLLRSGLAQREQRRTGSLHRILRRLDPTTAGRIHRNDVQKTIRALEICLLSRQPASSLFATAATAPLEGYRMLQIGLDPVRAELHERIARRTKAMFEAGLLKEVEELLRSGVPADAKAFESIGYKETLGLLQGRLTGEQAVELTTIATRQYAKRQLTWFRRDPRVRWLSGFGEEKAIEETAEGWVRDWLAAVA